MGEEKEINKKEEYRKARKWINLVWTLIILGITVPVIVMAITTGTIIEKGISLAMIVPLALFLVSAAVIVTTINYLAQAVYRVPTFEKHLITVRDIYYDIWESGSLYFLFGGFMDMKFARIYQGRIEVPISWGEKNTLQLKDTSMTADALTEIEITDGFKAHYVTEGGLQAVKKFVEKTLMDFIQTLFTEKEYTEERARGIKGSEIFTTLNSETNYKHINNDFNKRGIKLVNIVWQSEPPAEVKKAREKEVVAEHQIKINKLDGQAEAKKTEAEIDYYAEEIMKKEENISKAEAYKKAEARWLTKRRLHTIEHSPGLVIAENPAGLGKEIQGDQISKRRKRD